MVRNVRDQIKRFERLLIFLAFVLGIYLAAGSLLRGAEIPNQAFWKPWSIWFIVLLVSAVYVPLYAAYKELDARLVQKDQANAQLRQDLAVLCQRVAAEVAAGCIHLDMTELETKIWLCGSDGKSFKRDDRLRFLLPYLRGQSSGVPWQRGKGVAGIAWENDTNLIVDLEELHREHGRLGSEAFDELDAERRYGMTYREVAATLRYKGIAAFRLLSTDETPRLLGIFLLDYTASEDFDCIDRVLRTPALSRLLRTCEEGLTSGLAQVENGT